MDFLNGDRVTLPPELGGGEARFSCVFHENNTLKVYTTIRGREVAIAIPAELITKPEPTAVGTIYHSKKLGHSYVRVADTRVTSNNRWIRITGTFSEIIPRVATWEEIS